MPFSSKGSPVLAACALQLVSAISWHTVHSVIFPANGVLSGMHEIVYSYKEAWKGSSEADQRRST